MGFMETFFTVPEGYIPKVGAKINEFTRSYKKMSKSDENVNASVNILDEKDIILRKFKKSR